MLRLLAEAYRLQLMCGLEEMLRLDGMSRVAGVDEAGRGSLAGPVVAAAVVPREGCLVPGVDDSKRLGAKLREELAGRIRSSAVAWSVANVSPGAIDRINILEATKVAMSRCLADLRPKADCAVVDAVRLEGGDLPLLPVHRGETLSYAVACASILAKVERDRMMTDLDRHFPAYGFASNKGYGAPEHREALDRFGPTPMHRLTFRSVVPRTPEADAPRSVRRARAPAPTSGELFLGS